MEIFQTIWTSLTTENEVITNIIGIPTVFIEAYVSMLLFTLILNISTTKKQRIIYVCTISLFSIFSRFVIPTPYGSYVNAIAMVLSIMFILKVKFFKAIFALFIPLFLTAVVESIIAKLYSSIFGFDYIVGMNIPLHRFIGTLIMYFILYCFYLLLKYFKLNIPKFEVLDKKKKVLLAINTIFGIVLVCTQVYMITFYVSNIPFFVTLISILCLIAYFVISLYTTFTVAELETTSMKLEEAELYNKTLQILHDNIRAFKHDFWNIVQGIGGYIGKNDMEGLKKYYSKLVEDCHQVNNLTALSPSVVNNPAVYNVLAHKYHTADELGIKINLDVFMDLNELNINSYELTRILGILMNNAIEASKECEDKTINVTFRKDNKRPMQLIIIENTYKDKNIDTEKIYEKGYSTKEGNTGLGLWEIRQIMKKHNNLNLYTTKNSEYFSQQFEIFF